MWQCPACDREFTRINQRHTCGTGSRDEVIRNRPQSVVEVYHAIEAFAKQLGKIEIVARDRYVLFRSSRIFVDLSIMKVAVRVAIHLGRTVENPLFIKVVDDGNQVTHVAKISNLDELKHIQPLIEEAYRFSVSR
ncbi:DUF5655 domain-containing protein [Bowmanella yangjiangensis]|uniref:DUF5655 domain-containing protein n=1 Tax=Bowmanella yangjiangensis TaxID=2811230 RepID=UPI001E398CE7|nr:DUF5655 domain-containing protein [Bowmanella yangjiangensis]